MFGWNFSVSQRLYVASVTPQILASCSCVILAFFLATTRRFHFSIFPGEFQRVLVQCFMQNDEAFQRLLGDEAFQKLVMDTMAKEFYRKLTSPEDPD